MFCAKCGAPLNGATFCAACGTSNNVTAGVPIQPTPGAYQQPYGAAPVKTNGLAVAGFVTSILGCTALLGFILSLVALNQIKNTPTPQEGKGLATAGVVIGAVFTFGGLLWWIFAVALASSTGYYYSSY